MTKRIRCRPRAEATEPERLPPQTAVPLILAISLGAWFVILWLLRAAGIWPA